MKGILCLLVIVLICVSNVIAGNYAYSQFQEFKAKYAKQYVAGEEASRFEIFKQNLQKITEHNNKGLSYSMGITEFADMTHDEFLQAKTSAAQDFSENVDKFARQSVLSIPRAPPASLDYRTSTTPVIVPPVRNSGQCAGSVATAIVDSIASDYAKQNKDDVVVFDPKYVTDCDGQGCSGTLASTVWNFVTKYGLAWYYTGCPTAPGVGLCITGSNCTKSGSEAELQNAVYLKGPIAVMIDASRPSFQLYTSGIYYEPSCSSTSVNYMVLIVGYGTQNGQDYWIARNSWGTGWGQKGDVFLARNRNNNCGVATQACYAKSIKTCVCSL